MSEPLMKMVNVLDVQGRPMRNRETGQLVSVLVEMTAAEVEVFETERSVKRNPREGRNIRDRAFSRKESD